MNKRILHIAVPSIVSNVTIPLLGLVDTAITGHLGAAAFIAAIAVGTSIFSLCYWIFSFLRMGTGGLTAQAFGRASAAECQECLRKALTIAILAGVAIIALQRPIANVALAMMDATADVDRWARVYFHILVWGAPANLALSAMNGWFIGMQNARAPMVVAVSQNVLNIAVSCLLVMVLGWKVEGVATGTLVAQWMGCAMAAAFVARLLNNQKREKLEPLEKLESLGKLEPLEKPESLEKLESLEKPESPDPAPSPQHLPWSRFFAVNRDIFLRTLCLVAVMFSFTVFGSRQGDIVLAVNALLMQLFLLVSYFMDGFAYAGEAIGGSFLGARDRDGFAALKQRLFVWGGAFSALFTILFLFGGEGFIGLLTDNATVREAASGYLWVAVAIPAVSLGAFIYDGLFIGTTSTREMLISIAVATLLYFAIALSADHLAATCLRAGDWLWIAFLTYLGTRGAVQHIMMPAIVKRKF